MRPLKTYELVKNGVIAGIRCLDCGLVSFNENDVVNAYCGNCHEFHVVKASSRIIRRPHICNNAPVFRGTTIRVADLLGSLAGCSSFDDVFPVYPGLDHLDVASALLFASGLIKNVEEAQREADSTKGASA